MFGLTGRYATALYHAAGNKEILKAVEDDLKAVESIRESSELFRSFLEDPSVSRSVKKEGIVNVLASAKLNPITVQFFGKYQSE